MGGYKRLSVLVLITIGACLSVGAFAGHPAWAEPEEVVAAVAHDQYPEYLTHADGRAGGFAFDMMDAVAKRAGLSVTYRVLEAWADVVAALERGEADVIPVLSITPAREERMLFTRPVLTTPASLFVQQGNESIRDWSDLAGRRVGVIASGVSGQLLGERYKSAVIVPYPRLQDMLFALLTGEVDALVSFESAMWKVSDRARLGERIKVVGNPLSEVKRAVAVRQDLPDLRDRLDSTLTEFLNSREFMEVYAKWYADEPSSWTSTRMTWLAGRPRLFCCWGCSSGKLSRCAPRADSLRRALRQNCQEGARPPSSLIA